MKRMIAVALIAMLLVPGVAFANSSTNAALGLGAFAALGTRHLRRSTRRLWSTRRRRPSTRRLRCTHLRRCTATAMTMATAAVTAAGTATGTCITETGGATKAAGRQDIARAGSHPRPFFT